MSSSRHNPLPVFLLVLGVGAPDLVANADPQPLGRWLVDRARTFALRDTGAPTEAEAEYVLIWMRAAARLSPEFPDAYLWQFDLLHRLGRQGEALRALRTYCALAPEDVAARLNEVELSFLECQTLDARTAFCQDRLKTADYPPAVVSDLRCRLAELARRVGDEASALEEARAAVEAFPLNLQARTLLLQLEGKSGSPPARVRLLLDAVAANPARGAAVLELARYLDEISLHEQAAEWYRWAIDDFKRRNPGVQPPAEVWFELATAYCNATKLEEAFDACNRAMALDRNLLEAQNLMIRIARLRGLADVADKQRDMLATRFQELEPAIAADSNAPLAAQSAWFHARIKPDPARAVRLAKIAVEAAPDEPAYRRCLGWARLADNDAAGAEAVLAPLAAHDPWAAVGLARSLQAHGQRDRALEALRQAEKLRQSGEVYEEVVKLLKELGESPAPKPDHPDVLRVLESFDRAVLDFYADPSAALSLTARFAGTTVEYAEPILCTLTLTNTATYPVTLGPEGMVSNPEVLLSAAGSGQDGPIASRYVVISLARTDVLMPDERIVAQQTLDVGPVAAALDAEPQREQSLEFSFLFDPLLTDQAGWTSRLPGVQIPPVKVARKPVDATPTGVQSLLAQARSDSEARRIAAARTLAGLIAERRRAVEQSIDYTARSVDDAALQKALLATLRDSSAIVRAAALDALRPIKLDASVIEAASPLLSDANALVRLVAADLFASSQGPVFEPVLQRLAEDDSDPLVRQLAHIYLDVWKPTRSAPELTPPNP